MDPEWASKEAPLAAWNFALDRLRSASELPILFVYAPATPTLEGGRLVGINPEAALADEFSALCHAKGVGFVSLESAFLDYHAESNRFVTGFHTSRPWQGHYNAAGHRLVAEAIYEWVKAHPHVVYPD